MISFANQTVVRLRPRVKTERGSDIPDWSNPQELTIEHCTVQPAATSMSMDGRVLAISEDQTAYLPADADVQAGDSIRYQGQTYTIEGEPRRWPSPSGGLDHIQLTLRRWQG